MPKPGAGDRVNYIVVEPKDEARAKALIEGLTKDKGIKIEAYQARVDSTFTQGYGDNKQMLGKKLSFICSSDDSKFWLGQDQYKAVAKAGIMVGRYEDKTGAVQKALVTGMSKRPE